MQPLAQRGGDILAQAGAGLLARGVHPLSDGNSGARAAQQIDKVRRHAEVLSAVLHMVWPSAIFTAVTLVVFSIYGVFGGAWIRRSFAATYFILAGRLATQMR